MREYKIQINMKNIIEKKERKKIIIKIEGMEGRYLIRSQGVGSEGVYLNKIDLIDLLKKME